MSRAIERLARISALALLAAGVCWLRPHGQLHRPGEVPPFLAALAVMCAGYLIALRVPRFPAIVFWSATIGLRLVLLTMEPGDDLYRYVWEGRVLAAGKNPYLHAPDAPELAPLHDAMWKKVEHCESSAIYPPLAEICFAALAKSGGGVLAFKSAVALADLAICLLLARRFGRTSVLAYAWNPLVLYVFAGGGHCDSLFLLPLVAAWLAWKNDPVCSADDQNSKLKSAGVDSEGDTARFPFYAIFLGVAIAVKWLALPLLGWVAWREWERGARRAAVNVLALGALPLLASWAAVCAWTGEGTLHLAPGTFVRYARSAEFIPAFIAALIPATQFLNEIYLLPIALAWAFAIRRTRTFEHAAEWMFFALFILSPLLHAWYFVWLLPFAIATRNAGSVALTISGLAYFWVYHRFNIPDGEWRFTWPERCFIWLPFVALFLWSKWRGQPQKVATS